MMISENGYVENCDEWYFSNGCYIWLFIKKWGLTAVYEAADLSIPRGKKVHFLGIKNMSFLDKKNMSLF